MPYWGKIAGITVGLATGRIWIALIGLILGHQFDRGFAAWSSRADRQPNPLEKLPPDFISTLFQTMGFLAKSDGRVTEEEIRAARVTMHRLGLGPVEAGEAMKCFEQGKKASFPLHERLHGLRRCTARRADLRLLFLRLLLKVSLSKASLHRRERAALWTICSELDIGRVELAQLEAIIRAQKGFRKSAAGNADLRRLNGAYAVLGVQQSSTNIEIKQAYRRLMNRNHPDKLAGRGADQGLAAAASRRTREIREAYEMLKSRRSIR
ncbi:MAG: co-chaperone DjlA [Woeseia sp.]